MDCEKNRATTVICLLVVYLTSLCSASRGNDVITASDDVMSYRHVTANRSDAIMPLIRRLDRKWKGDENTDVIVSRHLTSRSIAVERNVSVTDDIMRRSRSSVMFSTSAAFLITKFKLYGTFNISMKVRTTQPGGVILFSGFLGSFSTSSKDFMMLELDGIGHIRYTFDVGSGIRTILQPLDARISQPINDNHWHHVSIGRTTMSQHILRVDEWEGSDTLPDSRSVYYDLPPGDDLYVGGRPTRSTTGLSSEAGLGDRTSRQPVRSKDGFQGCLDEVTLDDELWSLTTSRVEIPDEYREMIKEGCTGPTVDCRTSSLCRNSGFCIQQWNSTTCDCDMTSFTGPTCDDDGVSYAFGSSGGLITFTAPVTDRTDRKIDRLALGFITSKPDCLLLRVDSATSNDFIEVQLVGGKAYVVYNMGKASHPISSRAHRVDDGRFHVLSFTRSGANSTLRIDDLPQHSKQPPGRQLTMFNQQSSVQIGAVRDVTGNPERTFRGVIAGVWLNGMRLLDLVELADARTTIEGDVIRNVKPLRNYVIADVVNNANISTRQSTVIGTHVVDNITVHALVASQLPHGREGENPVTSSARLEKTAFDPVCNNKDC